MSAFLAFRNAAVTVLRPHRAGIVPHSLPTIAHRARHGGRGAPVVPQPPPNQDAGKPGDAKQGNQPRPKKEKQIAQHPKNTDIPHKTVQVLDANGTIHAPQQLTAILDSTDLQTHVIRLVTHKPPIVRIVTRLEDKMNQIAQKAEKKAKGTGRIETTTIQLTWLTADADYDHKISKAKEELEKGGTRVEILLKNKPRVRYPTRPEMEEQMAQVVTALEEVGTEWKESSIEKGKAWLYFQSRTQKARKSLPTQEEIEAQAKEALQLAERHAQLQKRSQEVPKQSLKDIWRQ